MFQFTQWKLLEPCAERVGSAEVSLLSDSSMSSGSKCREERKEVEREQEQKVALEYSGDFGDGGEQNQADMQGDSIVPIQVKPEGLPDNHPYSLAILKRFDFESSLQRMSVIVKDNYSGQLRVFSKGSPEKIRTLCREDTVPANFHEILEVYTEKGYRVLALGFRDLARSKDYWAAMKMRRDEVEIELAFLGFLVMENELKPISA